MLALALGTDFVPFDRLPRRLYTLASRPDGAIHFLDLGAAHLHVLGLSRLAGPGQSLQAVLLAREQSDALAQLRAATAQHGRALLAPVDFVSREDAGHICTAGDLETSLRRFEA